MLMIEISKGKLVIFYIDLMAMPTKDGTFSAIEIRFAGMMDEWTIKDNLEEEPCLLLAASQKQLRALFCCCAVSSAIVSSPDIRIPPLQVREILLLYTSGLLTTGV